jgi:hypothetical protein
MAHDASVDSRHRGRNALPKYKEEVSLPRESYTEMHGDVNRPKRTHLDRIGYDRRSTY